MQAGRQADRQTGGQTGRKAGRYLVLICARSRVNELQRLDLAVEADADAKELVRQPGHVKIRPLAVVLIQPTSASVQQARAHHTAHKC